MEIGNFNANDYLNKLHEEAEGNTDKGYIMTTDKDGLVLPEDAKKSFDWLNKEYQKGKVEVKVEVKGEGSSFKPGYDLQTDIKSVKDFKPGMFGDVKTEDTNKPKDGQLARGEQPGSPNNSKQETSAEDKDPTNGKEAKDGQQPENKKSTNSTIKTQQMEINLKKKKDDKQ